MAADFPLLLVASVVPISFTFIGRVFGIEDDPVLLVRMHSEEGRELAVRILSDFKFGLSEDRRILAFRFRSRRAVFDDDFISLAIVRSPVTE